MYIFLFAHARNVIMFLLANTKLTGLEESTQEQHCRTERCTTIYL